jgi:hypothetical protein
MGIRLIPIAGYGLASLGAGTLATGLGSTLVSAIKPLSEAFGQTERQQGENEDFDRTADPGRRIKRDFGEKFFDAFTGRDQSQMEKFGLDQSNKKINTAITNDGYDLQGITSALGTLELNKKLIPKLNDNQSQESYKLEVERAQKAINAAQEAQALYPGVDIKGKDLSGINLAVSQERKKEEKALQLKNDNRYGDTRKDKSDAMILALLQNQSSNKRIDNQMQLQMMQQDYNNRRLDLQEARDFRRERQAAIMQIMKGFSEMGKAFAY